jgi:hypothetical protein
MFLCIVEKKIQEDGENRDGTETEQILKVRKWTEQQFSF